MLRKAIAIAALCLLPALARAETANPYEITLGGNAANGNEFDGFTAGVNGSIGYYFSDNLEVALRQGVNYTDVGVGSALSASTRVALDLHFPMGDKNQIVPFVGLNIGFVYGDGVQDTWEAAPEGGVKFYVSPQTFVFVQAEYQFFFNEGDDASDSFQDGQFVYTMGIGFRF